MTDAIFKTFRALVPNPITDARFVSSSIAEPDATRVMPDGTTGEVAWVFGATYAVNQRVILATTHRVYISASAGVSNVSPNLDPTRWTDEGPTNKWAWADSEAATKTDWTSPLVITVNPGAITHIGLAGLKDVASVKVEMWSTPGGALVHDDTYTTNDTSSTTPLWDLYFTEPSYADLKIIDGLPTYPGCQVRITLSGYEFRLSAGLIAFGKSQALGGAEVGVSVIYRDYGYSTTNKWGNTVRTKGAKAKDLKCNAVFPISDANSIDRTMRELLDSGAIFIPSSLTKFNFMTTWGMMKPADITVDETDIGRATFEIEGLI